MTATAVPVPTDLTPHPTLAPTAGSAASLWRETMVFAGRNVRHIRQIPEKLLDVTMQPVMSTLLFAYVFGGAIAVEGNYREYLIGGILIQSLAFGLMGPATAIATDLTEGVLDRFRTLPVRRASYLLGHYVAELAGMALAITVLLGAGLIVGWRTHTDIAHLATAALLLTLFASAMIWTGTLVGLLVRSPDAVMGIGFAVVFPLTFVSNAFVPVGSMPDVLQWVAVWNPVTSIVAAVRELFGNPVGSLSHTTWATDHPVAAAFAWCLALLAVTVPLALRRYRSRVAN